MRLRVDFGHSGARKEVVWWQTLQEFPSAVIFNGDRWEWVVYSTDVTKQYDYILTFGLLSAGDPRWNECVDFERDIGHRVNSQCQCGSIHTSAPNGHMFYCPLWRKV